MTATGTQARKRARRERIDAIYASQSTHGRGRSHGWGAGEAGGKERRWWVRWKMKAKERSLKVAEDDREMLRRDRESNPGGNGIYQAPGNARRHRRPRYPPKNLIQAHCTRPPPHHAPPSCHTSFPKTPRLAMPRAAKPSGKTRHDPLHVQIADDETYAKYGKLSRPGKRRKSQAADDDEEAGEVLFSRIATIDTRAHDPS